MGDRALRVVIAEDNYLVREGTRRLLEDSGEVEVLAAVGDAEELIAAVADLRPDAVLTDIRMPPGHHMEGIEAAHDIRRQHPGTGVVVLSQHTDETYAFALLRDGTAGLAYLLKDRLGDLDDLILALRQVVGGGSVIDPVVVDSLVARRSRAAHSPIAALTPRETDVLREMAQGKTNAGIEQALHLSASSVEKHVSSIFDKLGVTRGRRSVYDELMLSLHDAAKLDDNFQKNSPHERIDFPAGSCWMTFTDMVLHAALGGEFALEQTFHLDIDQMTRPERAPIRVLERLSGKALA